MIKIEGRKLNIQDNERFIGLESDNKYETRQFEITEARLFNFDFRLEIKRADGIKDIAYLDKTVEADRIVLTWEVLEKNIGDIPEGAGSAWISIQLCGEGEHGIKWNSEPAMVQVIYSINASEAYPDPLPSEFEQIEQRVTAAKTAALEAAEQVANDKTEVAENLATILTKAQEAAESAAAALQSEINAKASEDNAKDYADEAERQADIARNNILNGVAAHNESEESHPYVLSEMVRIESIARGKASAKVFDTAEEMNDWLSDPDNVETLKIGDNLYIRDTNAPDYWWDGEQPQILEAQAINLSDYYTKQEVDARLPIVIEQSDYDEAVDLGQVIAGRIYYVVPDGALGDGDD